MSLRKIGTRVSKSDRISGGTRLMKLLPKAFSKRLISGRNYQGFTLVELLVVISIIGILAALLLVNFSNVRERGRDSARKSDFSQLKTALRLYYNDFQSYPASDDGVILGCGADGDTACPWGTEFSARGTKYIVLPSDPIGTVEYVYEQTAGGNGFILTAELENLSDPQANESQVRCGVTPGSEEAGVYMSCAD